MGSGPVAGEIVPSRVEQQSNRVGLSRSTGVSLRFAVRGRIRELIRTWPNLTETTVNGIHFVQEDSPDEIGTAIAEFVRK
jgi:uncharacterized protein YlzI (FlbEa/FlbD family)